MAEQVIFGKIDKKINSTSSTYTTILTTNVLLKENCSITSPVFILRAQFDQIGECNYAEWAGFFYWIDDIVSTSAYELEIYCTRDPLASFYADIKNGYAYVQHCSDPSKCNTDIDDARLGPETIDDITAYTKEILFTNSPLQGAGTVLLTTINDSSGAYAGVTTYAMTWANFWNVLVGLGNAVANAFSGYTTLEDLFKNAIPQVFANGSWRDAIVSCIYVPIDYAEYATWTAVSDLYIGAFHVTTSARAIANGALCVRGWYTNAAIDHSTLADQVPFLNLPKYRSLQFVTPSGFQEFNCPELINKDHVDAYLYINLMTGEYSTCLKLPGTDRILAEAGGVLAVDVLGLMSQGSFGNQVFNNVVDFATTTLGAAFGGYAGYAAANQLNKSKDTVLNGVSEGFTKEEVNSARTTAYVTDGIRNFTKAYTPMTSYGRGVSSSNGIQSLYIHGGISQAFYITGSYSAPEIVKYDPDMYFAYCDKYGYPCFRYYKLGDLVNYYVQCSGASVAAEGATRAEISTINSFVNGGIYLED